jgi:hypothetical protein
VPADIGSDVSIRKLLRPPGTGIGTRGANVSGSVAVRLRYTNRSPTAHAAARDGHGSLGKNASIDYMARVYRVIIVLIVDSEVNQKLS